ncbi:hypothetical protein PYW07_011169 [Mythimna separata]|uniref:Fatty acyl-CoA reductase n=1 Tax=Mythimna separata TaxID=271217 RepID=A0AAD8DK83_MYTSE|nr:hypothetical protein PYW07_011169 [Mythimna separata]
MDPAQAFINDLMARNQSMDEAMARGDSAIQQFYSDATVFVTGGSGFLGKQLIEKLLRATTVSKVFVLLRPKKEKEIEERFNEMLQEPVYDKLREQQPGFADRIVPIEGDVAQLRLGLSSNDWDILADQVNIIFHMAATTRLDTPLRAATMINTRGAREALLLGKACKNIKSYVHVSTAFSHACTNRVDTDILEEFYLSPVPPETMIKLAESNEESRLNDIAPGLTKTWLNNYLFSKAVAEEVVCSMSEDLPICVVRPAVVLHSIREPHPGWTDASCVYGASGLALSVGMGVVHAMLVHDRAQLNFIPVDYVTNATIAAGWVTAKRRDAGERNLKIYNVNTTPRNPIDIGRMLPMLRNDTIPNYPPPMAVAYSLYLQTNSPAIYWIYNWLLHMIPAYIIDGVCFILGKPRRAVKLYTKANKLIQLMTFVLLNNFDFVDKNTEALYESLSEVDREIFDFDVNKIDWLGIEKAVGFFNQD